MITLINILSANSIATMKIDNIDLYSMDNTSTYVGDLFPSFTQEDFDSGFVNYASSNSTINLQSNSIMRLFQNTSNIVGTVFIASTETPASNANIVVTNSNTNNIVIEVTANEDGRFQILGLEDDVYDWKIQKSGYQDAIYKGYDVCAGEITSIFTFYISESEPIIKVQGQTTEKESNTIAANDNTQISNENIVSTTSFSSTPTLSNFTVGINGVANTIHRYTYLCYVVSSEALGYSVCSSTYGMTDSQIKQYYAAQAVAANTFLEYAAKVYSKHKSAGYTVCNSACCQTYDTTKSSSFAISAVGLVCNKISSDWYANLQVYKSGSSYNYIYGAYFAHCSGATKTHPTDPALKSVSCTNIDNKSYLSGNGYGLCQYGAAKMAKNGSSWSSILQHYYSSTTSLCCFF